MSQTLTLLSTPESKTGFKRRRRDKKPRVVRDRRTLKQTEQRRPKPKKPETRIGIFELAGANIPESKFNLTDEEKIIKREKYRERFNRLPELTIDTISYSLFSHEELLEQAVFSVTSSEDEGRNTVNDPRSGVTDDNKECATCHGNNLECPGHFGILKLYTPIIHPLFRREVIDILTSVCNSCSRLLIKKELLDESILNLTGSKRLRAIAELSKKIYCRRKETDTVTGEEVTDCVRNPIYRVKNLKETADVYYTMDEKSSEADSYKTVEDIYNILVAIPEEDAEVLGFYGKAHPSRFILKSIPIIPICARPRVFQDGNLLNDDLTSMYKEIVRLNNQIKELENTPENEEKRTKLISSLIFFYSHFIDNTDQKYRPGKKKPHKDIKSRIQGKEGIIRNLIQGKRVNFSARTVLSPDPSLKFGQIRIPREWASVLTFPEIVSSSNISRLNMLLEKGQVTHITPSRGKFIGRRVRVKNKNRELIKLQIGDTVDRWLQTGDRYNRPDFVLFGRNPTLHKQGLMSYEVILGNSRTIGLHLAYTTPHNYDCDGDEGTIHAAQSREALIELAMLTSVKKCILNSQDNKNIIGVVYDALTGTYLMTQKDTFVDYNFFLNTVMFLESDFDIEEFKTRLNKYKLPINSGRALFSAVLPPDFYYRKNDVLIRDGILVSGVITKAHIGTSHGSIVQVLMNDYGEEETVNFLTDIYTVAGKYLDERGFSVGLDDCYLTGKDPEKEIAYEVQRAKMLVRSMGWKLTDPIEEERREKQIIAYLNTAEGLGKRISEKYLNPFNAFNVMATSGAKGSSFNIAQITGILGQQFLQGQRMPESISGGRRCLPYFPEDDLDPASRGFCVNSFLTGLSPAEMFFHQAGGREGLTDTSVKTAKTGHIHRNIVKALEDIKAYKDGSARNAFGVIFQYIYGMDGFDAGDLEFVNTKTGRFTSFVNIKRLAGRINSKYGYETRGEPKIELIKDFKTK